MEPYEKVYVKPAFLETDHGATPCEDCHGGNPDDPNWQTAHEGVVRDPSMKDATRVCGDCHLEVVEPAAKSLHFTLAPMKSAIRQRAGGEEAEHWPQVDQAFERHCGQCHTSCGQCHVSRPDYVLGGLLAGHMFLERPEMDVTCASCHGGRVHAEYTGGRKGQKADVHFDDEDMECLDCHQGETMHQDASNTNSRFESAGRPSCADCHEETLAGQDVPEQHQNHIGKVACQVCHGQANKHCFGCHVGTDDKGLPYYKNQEARVEFKIGRNPRVTGERPDKWVVVRHAPTNPELFDFYLQGALPAFDSLPTWKLDTPHNIRRVTPQNKACNNCHGHPELFLSDEDMPEAERQTNAGVIVPRDMVPGAVEAAGE